MGNIGILVFGAVKMDPGVEIEPVIEKRIPTETPFPVEFGRYSRSRGNGPTVVPHPAGKPVDAEVLVLESTVSLQQAKDMLFRREIDSVGSSQGYRESDKPTSMLIADKPGFCDLEHVLYVDFRPEGKLEKPDAKALAKAAVESVKWAPQTRDGIRYLMEWIVGGEATPLTAQYEKEILTLTGTASLADAWDVAHSQS